MAFTGTWGAWDYSGGNGMRVGIQVTWATPTHGSTSVDATVEVWTQNQYTYGDDQKLTYGGVISGSQSFTNNHDSSEFRRDTLTYTYTYTSTSYGVSPGKVVFSATLSGAYNGVTPSVSVSSSVPARPYAAPAAPTSVALARASDASLITSWVRHATSGEPYDTQAIQRSLNGAAYVALSWTVAGTATSYNDTTALANNKYRYQVRAQNSIGSSGFVVSNDVWTTPSAPSTVTRTGANGANQTVAWTNTVGYPVNTEWQTEVWRSDDNAGYVLLTTVAGSAVNYVDTYPATHAAVKFKYITRTKTTSGAVLYSAWSNETTQTAGTTTPPNKPTGLTPNGIVVDPSQLTVLAWTFNAGQGGDTQTQYQIRHRINGTSTWTTPAAVIDTASTTSLAINTYADGNIVEWQVSTKGADPTFSQWSDSAVYTNTVTVITPPPVIYPADIDIRTGQVRANSLFDEVRNYLMRTQSQLFGGGTRSVDATFNVNWTARFLAICLGTGANTANVGYFDINPPFSNTVTNKALSGNIATLTFSGTHRFRAGETVIVSGVDATFNGTFVVRTAETSFITYDKVATTVSPVASGGSVGHRIQGHGSAADQVATTAGKIPMATTWIALYYEMPFGWGGGSTPRKNGVVTVTFKSLTANVATLTVVNPHYFTLGDPITIAIGDPVFDGSGTVTAMTVNTITYARTGSNVSTTAASGYVKPFGSSTNMGNYHLVSYLGAFTVPSNWILLAMRNGDTGQVEWSTGDKAPAGADSNQIIVGDPAGGNTVLNNNQLRARTGSAETGDLYLQYAGSGDVRIGDTGGATILCTPMTVLEDFDSTDQTAYSSATQTPGSPVLGLTFVAPRSGKVLIEGSAGISCSAAGTDVRCYVECKSGATIGSGTVQGTTGDTDTGPSCRFTSVVAGEVRNVASGHVLVSALTAGSTYNICMRHRVAGGGGSITVLWRRVTCLPSM